MLYEVITLPPLRERGNDILLLALEFIRQLSKKFGKSITGLAQPAAACLLGYHWPGNVRELHNIIERALALSVHDLLTVEDLPEQVKHPSGEAPLPTSLVDPGTILPLEEMERRYT